MNQEPSLSLFEKIDMLERELENKEILLKELMSDIHEKNKRAIRFVEELKEKDLIIEHLSAQKRINITNE